MTPEPDLTLSREDLYELVWSKPMVELAQDLGLSDVALAKRCRKLGVPVPGRGYWARVAAGQEPHRPTLAKREDQFGDAQALAFASVAEDAPAAEAPDLTPGEAAIRAEIDVVPVTLLASLEFACPPIQRLARREGVMPAKAIAWARQADRRGPIPAVHVSDTQAARALSILDTVLRAAASLGWPFEAVKPEAPAYPARSPEPVDPTPPGALTVAGEPIAIRIDEPTKRIPHVRTPDEERRLKRGEHPYLVAWDYLPSGRLCLQIHEPDSRYGGRSWKDGKRPHIEDQTRDILHALYDLALKIKAQRAEHAQREREQREEERLKRERGRRRDIELKLIHELERQAGAWFRARLLNRYVRAACRALGSDQIMVKRGEGTVDFFAWAQGYVNQLDPLHPADRNDDLLEDRISWHADIELQKTLARLAGFEGQKTWKITGTAVDQYADDKNTRKYEDDS
jgi:hypothetical protein